MGYTRATMANQAFDVAAMGDYPYESSYFSGDPAHPFPAWPARAVCAQLAGEYLANTRVYRRLGRPLFIDKNPNNFRNVLETGLLGRGGQLAPAAHESHRHDRDEGEDDDAEDDSDESDRGVHPSILPDLG